MRLILTSIATAIAALTSACGAETAPVSDTDRALSADAAQFAKGSGIPQAEAERRLRAQAVLGDHLARLREAHSDRIAGIYYQQAPDFRVIVRLKGEAPVRADAVNESPVSDVPIEFRTGAAYSLDELLAATERHRGDLTSIEGLQGYGVDERTGELMLDVYAPGREAETRVETAALEQRIGIPLAVNFAPAPLTDQ